MYVCVCILPHHHTRTHNTHTHRFVNGKLIGGCDVIKQMHEDEELIDVFPKNCLPKVKTPESKAVPLNVQLKKLVNSSLVMLFMKGTPQAPRCGFSRQVVDILQNQIHVRFGYFDILSDQRVRAGLKKYSNWPTYPQL